jgi:diaminohydroxyphosphoribosylaminopyrimidine deaminase/5-amino-6-(5-phosphoribosylamino)uracil reductase
VASSKASSQSHPRRAAELAALGRLRVDPNPLVGCVLVKRNRVVGEGYHAYWGGPHAEANALKAAGGKAKGATAYVTLEPCGHGGKTPPCAEALVRAGVREVIYAHPDPNPETAGRGPALLRESGIKVVLRGKPPQYVRELLQPYLAHLKRKRPWVIAKWAMTLDGRIATRKGDSKWITADETRRWTHRHLRARVDAILCGAGTVLTDDPALTNRSGRGKQPLRVIVCGRRPLWPRSKVLTDGAPTLLAVPQQFRPPPGAETLVCGGLWKVDPDRLLRELYDLGLRRVLVEGGGEVLGSFFDAGLVDQAAVFLGPRIVGGISAVQAVAGRGQARMAEALELEHATWHRIGPDQVIEGYVGPASG